MKTLSKSLLALLFVGTLSFTAQASEIAPEKGISKEIAAMLSNIQLPDGEDLIANVKFLINAEHEIVIVSVDADTPYAEGLIKGRLNYKKVKSDEAKANKINTITIKIKQP